MTHRLPLIWRLQFGDAAKDAEILILRHEVASCGGGSRARSRTGASCSAWGTA